MSLSRINNNLSSLTASRQVNQNSSLLQNSLNKLSTGLRINKAADDAAGLFISEEMRAQYNALTQASRNAQDAISMVQTAEGATQEIHSMAQRVRELSVQAANGTLTSEDRQAIQAEIDQLTDQIDQTVETTEFNDQPVLDGSYSGTIQTGANAGQTMTIEIDSMSAASLGLAGLDVTSAAGAQSAIAAADNAIATVSQTRSDLGATQNRLEHAINNLQVGAENLMASESTIRDTDYASEVTNLVRAQLLQQSSTAVLTQANIAPRNVSSLLS